MLWIFKRDLIRRINLVCQFSAKYEWTYYLFLRNPSIYYVMRRFWFLAVQSKNIPADVYYKTR